MCNILNKIARAPDLPMLQKLVEDCSPKNTRRGRIEQISLFFTILLPYCTANLFYEGALYFPKLISSFNDTEIKPISLIAFPKHIAGIVVGAITFIPAVTIYVFAVACLRTPLSDYPKVEAAGKKV